MKRTPVENWIMRRRSSLPTITKRMMLILTCLRSAKTNGYPFVALADAHKKTLMALVERDWIVSEDMTGARYTITGRGLKALKVCEAPPRYHYDGTCPTCGKRPRAQRANGKLAPYCKKCTAAMGQAAFAEKGWQLKEETPCSRCKKRPRHVYPSGKRITYCTHCRKVLRRKERRRKMKRKLWLISIGRPPTCLKCDQPVYHTPNTVYDYCYTHYREQQNAYLRKQKTSRMSVEVQR